MKKINIKINDIIYDIYGEEFKVKQLGTDKCKFESLDTGEFIFVVDFVHYITKTPYFYLTNPTIRAVPVVSEDIPDLKIDDVILVYRYSTKSFVARYFSHFGKNNEVNVFRFGATSISTEQTYEIGKYTIPSKDTSIIKQLEDLNLELDAKRDAI